MPLLSVVVPFFNVETYLAETLESIARQRHDQLEVILVNDGSEDGSRDIAQQFAQRDRRFMIVDQPNGGLSVARNTGAAHATGEFLTFADGDDLLPPYAYALMVQSLTTTGSDLVAGGVRRYTSAGAYESAMHRAAFAETRLRTHISREPALIRDWTAWNKMFRRSFYEEAQLRFPEGIQYEDAPVTVRAYALSSSTDILSPPVYYWRTREWGQLSITQSLADRAYYLDRITSMTLVSEFLESRSDAALRTLYEVTAVQHHFPVMIKAVASAPRDIREVFLDASAEYLRHLAPDVIGGLSDSLNYQITEILAGRIPTVSGPGTRVASGSVAKRIAKRVNTRAVETRVNRLEWDGGRLVVRGQAEVVAGRSARLQPLSTRLMWLRELTSRRLVLLSVRPVRRNVDPIRGDSRRAKFEVHLDPAALKERGAWRPGRWRFALAFVDHRGVHRTALRTGDSKPIALPAQALDEVTTLVPRIVGGVLMVDVAQTPVIATAVEIVDGVLTVRGRVPSRRVSAAWLLIGRVEGLTDHSVPAVVARDGRDTTFALSAPLDDLATALGPVDLAPVAGASDTWLLSLHLAEAGTTHEYPIMAGTVPGTVHRGSGYLASIHADVAGRMNLTVRPPVAAAVSLQWDNDYVLHLRGIGPARSGDRLVLRLRGQRELREWPIVPDSRGEGWSAQITPLAVSTAAGPTPLRAGLWGLLLSTTTQDGTERLTNLPVSGGALTAVGVVAPSDDRRFWLDRLAPDGAALISGSTHRDREVHRVRQMYLRDVHYPRVRDTDPLRDTVLYMSFGGRQYSDSPRAVHEALRSRGDALHHLWVIKDDQVVLPPGTDSVMMWSTEWYEALATARYLVVNSHLPVWFRRREGQVVVQTWHGTPLKKIGLDIDDPRFADAKYQENLVEEVPNWTYLVSPNSFSSPHMLRAFGFTGELLEYGYPRNDVLVAGWQPRIRQALAERMGIPTDKEIILYAPTWRDDQYYGGGRYKFDARLDFDAAREALADRYVLLVRRHPNVVDDVPGAGNGFVWDVSTYPDIADLMAVTDVLLTDYSSMMFDFAVTGRPMLFFTYDLEHYRDTLRGFYFDFESTAPGPLLATSEEVVAALADLDTTVAAYGDRYAAFQQRFCDFDDGNATGRLVDRVFGATSAAVAPHQVGEVGVATDVPQVDLVSQLVDE